MTPKMFLFICGVLLAAGVYNAYKPQQEVKQTTDQIMSMCSNLGAAGAAAVKDRLENQNFSIDNTMRHGEQFSMVKPLYRDMIQESGMFIGVDLSEFAKRWRFRCMASVYSFDKVN